MKSVLLVPSALCILALAGCGNPPGAATYIDPNGQHAIVDVGRINYQDFDSAADNLVQSLLASGAIKEKTPGQMPVVAISKIVNETDQQFDTDALMNNIRIALVKSQKAQIVTNTGLNGVVADPLAGDIAARNAFAQGQASPAVNADYTVSGKIMSDKTYAGDVRQSAYTFYLQLTDPRTNTAPWIDQKRVVKQGTQSSIGF